LLLPDGRGSSVSVAHTLSAMPLGLWEFRQYKTKQ
jgi:hypothetical protein